MSTKTHFTFHVFCLRPSHRFVAEVWGGSSSERHITVKNCKTAGDRHSFKKRTEHFVSGIVFQNKRFIYKSVQAYGVNYKDNRTGCKYKCNAATSFCRHFVLLDNSDHSASGKPAKYPKCRLYTSLMFIILLNN